MQGSESGQPGIPRGGVQLYGGISDEGAAQGVFTPTGAEKQNNGHTPSLEVASTGSVNPSIPEVAEPLCPYPEKVHRLRGFLALLAVSVTLLGGACNSQPTPEDIRQKVTNWAKDQTSWPGLTLEDVKDDNSGEVIALQARVTVTDKEEAKKFFDEYRLQASPLKKTIPYVEARVAWPVTGGTTTVHLNVEENARSSSSYEHSKIDLADNPLPLAATERHLGWSDLPLDLKEKHTSSDNRFIMVDELVVSDPMTYTRGAIRDKGEGFNTYTHVFRTSDQDPEKVKYLGPDISPAEADSLDKLAREGVHITNYRGKEIWLSDETDVPKALDHLYGDWTVHAGRVEYLITSESKKAVPALPSLLERPGVISLRVDGTTVAAELEAARCRDTAYSFLATPLKLRVTCVDGSSRFTATGPRSDVLRELPVLEQAHGKGLAGVDEYLTDAVGFKLTLDPANRATWPDAFRELRGMGWQDRAQFEATVTGGDTILTFESTTTGKAETANGQDSEPGKTIIEAWDASAG